MIDIIQYDWQNVIWKMILWGIIILLIFVPVRLLMPYVIRNKSSMTKRREQWKLLQLLVWIFYFSWFFFLFADTRSWFTLIIGLVLLALLYLLYKFWLTDLISGILFRNQYQLSEGDMLHLQNLKGKVIRCANTFIELENQEGHTIYLSYSQLHKGFFMKSESKMLSPGFTFDLHVRSEDSFEVLSQKIKTTLISLPWTSIKKEPAISLKQISGGVKTLTISVNTIDRAFTGKIEQFLRNKYEKPMN
ncbi:MAG: mechanosensitive ion channel [Bacteroidales bacterium]|nr:mechanosensitive ion channel [Bacteroidales bacterium]